MNSNRTVLPTFALIDMAIPETTKVLDDATMQHLVNQVGAVYSFDQQATMASTLKAGDIMASSSGQGLLRKVTSVSTSAGFFTLQEFKTVFIVKNNQSLSIEVGRSIPIIDNKADIYEYLFAPIPTTIPFVIIVPKFTVSIGVNGEVGFTLSSKVAMDATYTAGVHYKKDNGWNPISDYVSNFVPDPLNISAGGSIKGFVEPNLSLLIDGVVGPSATLEGYLKVVADIFSSPWWTLFN